MDKMKNIPRSWLNSSVRNKYLKQKKNIQYF